VASFYDRVLRLPRNPLVEEAAHLSPHLPER
jgi:hypothetical protein